MTIRTRFAPSPTGFLHIGSARTALFNWLLARRHNGVFVLRIEDTDTQRSTAQSIDQILEAMAWLGLDADVGPFFQMKRLGHYQKLADELLEAGHAYYCYCTREELAAMREQQKSSGAKPRYDGRCRDHAKPRADVDPVVRFKTPTIGDVRVNDRIRGYLGFDNGHLVEFVIMRSDGGLSYYLKVVVVES